MKAVALFVSFTFLYGCCPDCDKNRLRKAYDPVLISNTKEFGKVFLTTEYGNMPCLVAMDEYGQTSGISCDWTKFDARYLAKTMPEKP